MSKLRAAEFIMAGFEGQEAPTEVLKCIREEGLRAIILFKHNIKGPDQLKALCDRLWDAAGSRPFFIALDQEGGMVQRLRETALPSNMGLAASGNPELAFEMGQICGRELAWYGVNLNLAPVLDVNNNPKNPGIGIRSYSDSPATVERFGRAYIRGIQSTGVSCTAKHYPGKGAAALDAHYAMPTVGSSSESLWNTELLPFRGAVAEGVDFVMSSHVAYPALDASGKPATTSHPITTGILKDRIGFGKAVVTDCLQMAGMVQHGTSQQAAVGALLAGADLSMLSHVWQEGRKGIDQVEAAIHDGTLTLARLQDADTRLRKAFRGRPAVPPRNGPHFDHPARLQRLVPHFLVGRHLSTFLPLRPGTRYLALLIEPDIASPVEGFKQDLTNVLSWLPEGLTLEKMVLPGKADAASLRQTLEKARAAEAVLLFSHNANLYPEHTAWVREFGTLPRLLLVALRNPYDCWLVPPATPSLALFGFTALTLHALREVLAGRMQPAGTMPVSAPQATCCCP